MILLFWFIISVLFFYPLIKYLNRRKKINNINFNPDCYSQNPKLTYSLCTKDIKFDEQEILDIVKKMRVVISQLNNTLKNTPANDLKEYHKIFRQVNPKYKNESLYSFNNIDKEAWLNNELYEFDDYHELLSLKADDKTIELKDFSGQILAFEIGINVQDGVSAMESKGFVDDLDIPPYDTWFHLKKIKTKNNKDVGLLLCWIPYDYENIMEGAKLINCCEPYFWLNEDLPVENSRIMHKLNNYTEHKHIACR